jgi:hypothetical protein
MSPHRFLKNHLSSIPARPVSFFAAALKKFGRCQHFFEAIFDVPHGFQTSEIRTSNFQSSSKFQKMESQF